MNNPVSKTRLIEMYDKLKLLRWPQFKDNLRAKKLNPKDVNDLIQVKSVCLYPLLTFCLCIHFGFVSCNLNYFQKTFVEAADAMKRKKQEIDDALGLYESRSGDTPQKVQDCLTVVWIIKEAH